MRISGIQPAIRIMASYSCGHDRAWPSIPRKISRFHHGGTRFVASGYPLDAIMRISVSGNSVFSLWPHGGRMSPAAASIGAPKRRSRIPLRPGIRDYAGQAARPPGNAAIMRMAGVTQGPERIGSLTRGGTCSRLCGRDAVRRDLFSGACPVPVAAHSAPPTRKKVWSR